MQRICPIICEPCAGDLVWSHHRSVQSEWSLGRFQWQLRQNRVKNESARALVSRASASAITTVTPGACAMATSAFGRVGPSVPRLALSSTTCRRSSLFTWLCRREVDERVWTVGSPQFIEPIHPILHHNSDTQWVSPSVTIVLESIHMSQ